MTSVNELNAYQRGMKEGIKVGEQKQNSEVLSYVKAQRNAYLELNYLAKAKMMSKILDKFIYD